MLKNNRPLNPELAPAAKMHLEPLTRLIENHAISTFFEVSITQTFSRKVQLAFKLREGFTEHPAFIQSLQACVIDCAAKVASWGILGASMITESEVQFLPATCGRNFSVKMEVGMLTKPYATFSGEIYRQERRGRVRLVECHGTLCAGQALNQFSNVTTLAGEAISN